MLSRSSLVRAEQRVVQCCWPPGCMNITKCAHTMAVNPRAGCRYVNICCEAGIFRRQG
jgi:hypothetical protein